MADLEISNTFVDGTAVRASDHNANFSDIEAYVNARNSGSESWEAVKIAGSSVVPLIVDNGSSAANIAQFQQNGTDVLVVGYGGVVTMASQPAARAYRSGTAQTITDATETKVQFNAETYDRKSEFDAATNYRYTATAAGLYLVSSSLALTAGSATAAKIKIYKNGSEVAVVDKYIPYAYADSLSISDVLSLVATDYVEIYVYLDAAGTVPTVDYGTEKSFFQILKVA